MLRHEIGHQWHMMEQMAHKGSYIVKAREALPGMTGGIIETLGLVIGLLAAHLTTLTIGLMGIIAMIGGMTAIMSISFISSKGHHDFCEGRAQELDIKKEVHPISLRRELERVLPEKGISKATVRLMMDGIGDDRVALSNLTKAIKISEEAFVPKETVKMNSLFYASATTPILIPFLLAGGHPMV